MHLPAWVCKYACMHTYTHTSFWLCWTDDERVWEREIIVFGEGQMDREKRTGWMITRVRETIWARKMCTCREKTTYSLLDRVRDTHVKPHMHVYLPKHSPARLAVWWKYPSSHRKNLGGEMGENFLLLECLLEKVQNSCTSNVGLSLLTMFNIWLNLWHS